MGTIDGKGPWACNRVGEPIAVAGALGQQVLAGGSIVLNADMDCELGFLPGPSHGNVLLHELGHVMNLGHVDDAREIMRPQGFALQQSLDYGPGDTLGFHALRGTPRHVWLRLKGQYRSGDR